MKISGFFLILLLVFVAIFSVQNASPLTVHFLAWELRISAALVIQLAALLAGLAGFTAGACSQRLRRTSGTRKKADQVGGPSTRQPAGEDDAHTPPSAPHSS